MWRHTPARLSEHPSHRTRPRDERAVDEDAIVGVESVVSGARHAQPPGPGESDAARSIAVPVQHDGKRWRDLVLPNDVVPGTGIEWNGNVAEVARSDTGPSSW